MAGPLHTVWVRHGESEHNLAVRADKLGLKDLIPPEVYARPDWEHPLTPRGHEQAQAGNEWLTDEYGDPEDFFDAFLCTIALRGRQTAGHLAPNAMWRKHDAILEQDWGEYGMIPYSERQQRFAHTTRMREAAKFFARPDGGESPYDQLFRMRDIQRTLNKKYVNKRLLLAAHGGTLMIARYMNEHMLPEEFHEVERDPAQTLGNCAILEYSRVNPYDDKDIAPFNRWRRITQPDDPTASPFGGEWCELPGRREYSGHELLVQAAAFPPLIPDEIFDQIPLKADDGRELPRS